MKKRPPFQVGARRYQQVSATGRREFAYSERRQRITSTPPATMRISPSAIQRQELLTRLDLALALAGSAGARVCTGVEADGRGNLVLSNVRRGVAVGVSVGNAVAVGEWAVGDVVAVGGLAVGDACVAVWVEDGVGLPMVGTGVGERDAVADLVAVAAPNVGSSVEVGDGSELVGAGVSEGTPGGAVGARVGGGAVGTLAVGVLGAPVGVIVGMVWFR